VPFPAIKYLDRVRDMRCQTVVPSLKLHCLSQVKASSLRDVDFLVVKEGSRLDGWILYLEHFM
jgi:hypothetical protein